MRIIPTRSRGNTRSGNKNAELVRIEKEAQTLLDRWERDGPEAALDMLTKLRTDLWRINQTILAVVRLAEARGLIEGTAEEKKHGPKQKGKGLAHSIAREVDLYFSLPLVWFF